MNRKQINTGSLLPQELEAVYAISKVVAEAIDIDSSLNEIITLARSVFIFDNAVLYLQNHEGSLLEPAFARAIGRGRSSEADLAWGEVAANEAFQTGYNYIHQPAISMNTDRLDQRFYLGLPMVVGGKIIGALVFIRFGGPVFTEEQINLAEFIAEHVTQLLEHQRLVERIANLEAERRLAALQEDFIAAVSHELNTPLGFIKGYTTTLLRSDTQWDEKTRLDFLTIIDEETDHLSELIDELLDSSRLQSGSMGMDFQPLNLNLLIQNIIERLETRYNNLEIVVEVDFAELTIHADSKRLSQVLDNLLSNAAKYAPRSTVAVSIKTDAEQVIISIADRGPGIPQEHLAHLFKRFYRVPERSAGVRGSGLGLYIADKIISAHGGNISVESQVGHGTIFNVFLPINPAPITAMSNQEVTNDHTYSGS